MSTNKYIIKFPKDVTEEQAKEVYEEVEKSGGEVTLKKHDSKVMKYATATMPDSFTNDLQSKFSCIDYIEPDGEMKTQ